MRSRKHEDLLGTCFIIIANRDVPFEPPNDRASCSVRRPVLLSLAEAFGTCDAWRRSHSRASLPAPRESQESISCFSASRARNLHRSLVFLALSVCSSIISGFRINTAILSSSLERMLRHLETQCTADYCRSSDFAIERLRVASWLASDGSDRVRELCGELDGRVASLPPSGRARWKLVAWSSDDESTNLQAFSALCVARFARHDGSFRYS